MKQNDKQLPARYSYTLDVRTVTPHFPGIGRYVRNLATHMLAQLEESERLTLLAQKNAPFTLPDQATHATSVRTITANASPFSIWQQVTIPRLLNRDTSAKMGQSLYHSPYYLMPYRLPCPAVLTVYDVIGLIHPQVVSTTARMFFRVTTALALRASARVTTISHASRADLLARFSIDPDSVTTIHLAADDRFSPSPIAEQQRMRAAYGLPNGYILYFGINKPHKNLVRLIDAYASLRSSTPLAIETPPLVIAGAWDSRYPEAKARAAQLRLGDSVRFLGRIVDDQLPALYSAATAFVFPSRYEGFGLPILEAMACGTPVACAHSSSLPEVAGDAAYYFDAEDTESIDYALRALVGDVSLRRNLVERGFEQARRFSWQRTATETLDLYRSTLETTATISATLPSHL